MKFKHFKFNALFLILGILMGFLLTRYSGRILTGQPNLGAPPKTNDGPEYSHRQPISPGDLTKLFPHLIVRRGNAQLPELALTFDDGPDHKYTPQILDTLKKYKIKATFFVVGTQIQKNPAVFQRIIREGHEIGNHSYQHLKVSELSTAAIRFQLQKNNEIIRRSGGPKETNIFRPPYSAIDPASITTIGKQRYQIVLWTIDSLDWRALKKPQVEKNILPAIENGSIILQHCAADSKKEDLSGSVNCLPDIIRTAHQKGFRFVTISQLLKDKNIKVPPPTPPPVKIPNPEKASPR